MRALVHAFTAGRYLSFILQILNAYSALGIVPVLYEYYFTQQPYDICVLISSSQIRTSRPND